MGAFAPASECTGLNARLLRYNPRRSMSSIERVVGVSALTTWTSNESQMLPTRKLMNATPCERVEPMPNWLRAARDVSRRVSCPTVAQYVRYSTWPALVPFAAPVSTITPSNFFNHCLFGILDVRAWDTMSSWTRPVYNTDISSSLAVPMCEKESWSSKDQRLLCHFTYQ